MGDQIFNPRTARPAELRHWIAEHLGYKVVDLNDNPHGARVRGPNWTLIAPNGATLAYAFTADDAISSKHDWPGDMNAATNLLLSYTSYEWSITDLRHEADGDERRFKCGIESNPPVYAWAETPPQAMCRAWALLEQRKELGV